MRGVHALIVCLLAGLALSGCMHSTTPVATAPPQSDLDYMAYGRPYRSDPAAALPSRSAVADSGGAISALRSSFAASPRATYAPAPAVYAAAMPVVHDRTYRLDAGDKLRVVVYGQEGLTNIYAIDAGGPNTTPLIGYGRGGGRAHHGGR